MSSAGHMLDMIQRNKQNRALLKARQQRNRRIRQMYLDSMPPDLRRLPFPTLPPEDIERIKAGVRKKLRRERQIMGALYISATALALWAMIRLFWF